MAISRKLDLHPQSQTRIVERAVRVTLTAPEELTPSNLMSPFVWCADGDAGLMTLIHSVPRHRSADKASGRIWYCVNGRSRGNDLALLNAQRPRVEARDHSANRMKGFLGRAWRVALFPLGLGGFGALTFSVMDNAGSIPEGYVAADPDHRLA